MKSSPKKVIKFPGVRKHSAVSVSEAMSEAITALGGYATVESVTKYIDQHYKHRAWSPYTIKNYFYHYSKTQKFIRLNKKVYMNYNASTSVKRKVA